MKLLFRVPAGVFEEKSGIEVSAPDTLHGRLVFDGQLGDYVDSDLADAGVSGGTVRVVVERERAELQVDYLVPGSADDKTLDRLRTFTMVQFEDGAGEGGFEVHADGKQLLVVADLDSPVKVECTDGGCPVPEPSRIAIAARDGDLRSLRAEIDAGMQAIDSAHQGYTGLHLAILYGHVEAARMLLDAGADPNRPDSSESTPLELCVLSNSLSDERSRELALLLLDAGANVQHVAPDGESARTYAYCRGKLRTAAIL